MSMTDNPVSDLSRCLAHAMYQGFPEIQYQDRDWSSPDRSARVEKTRQHAERDLEVVAMFPQIWSSTALGFGGLGGQAITTAYTVVVKSNHDLGYCVYFGARFAYRVARPLPTFFADVQSGRLATVKDHKKYESQTDLVK